MQEIMVIIGAFGPGDSIIITLTTRNANGRFMAWEESRILFFVDTGMGMNVYRVMTKI